MQLCTANNAIISAQIDKIQFNISSYVRWINYCIPGELCTAADWGRLPPAVELFIVDRGIAEFGRIFAVAEFRAFLTEKSAEDFRLVRLADFIRAEGLEDLFWRFLRLFSRFQRIFIPVHTITI